LLFDLEESSAIIEVPIITDPDSFVDSLFFFSTLVRGRELLDWAETPSLLNSGALSRYPEEEEEEEEEEGVGADPPSPEGLEEALLSPESERLDELFDRKDKRPLFFFFESSPSSDVVFWADVAPEAPSARGSVEGEVGEVVPREESERGLFLRILLEEGEAGEEDDGDDEEDEDEEEDEEEDDLRVKAEEESEGLLLFRRPPNSFPFLEA